MIADSIRPVIYENIGLRANRMQSVFLVAFGLVFLSPFTAPNSRPGDLMLTAVVIAVVASVRKVSARRKIARGEIQNSYFAGNFIFRSPKFPSWLTKARRLERHAAPAVCILTGYLLLGPSHAVGLYLIFSGLCLNYSEFAMRRREFHRMLDLHDAFVRAQAQSDIAEVFASESPSAPTEATPIATGLSRDISNDIKNK